jgi:hypothetical protein
MRICNKHNASFIKSLGSARERLAYAPKTSNSNKLLILQGFQACFSLRQAGISQAGTLQGFQACFSVRQAGLQSGNHVHEVCGRRSQRRWRRSRTGRGRGVRSLRGEVRQLEPHWTLLKKHVCPCLTLAFAKIVAFRDAPVSVARQAQLIQPARRTHLVNIRVGRVFPHLCQDIQVAVGWVDGILAKAAHFFTILANFFSTAKAVDAATARWQRRSAVPLTHVVFLCDLLLHDRWATITCAERVVLPVLGSVRHVCKCCFL